MSGVSKSSVDYWLDTNKYVDYVEDIDPDESKKSLVFNVDMVRLASVRKAISNFVCILTRQNIPVYFNDVDENVNIGGKQIFISAGIRTKQDFDVAVGTALHEAAHTLKTDFDVIKTMWANIPPKIWKASDAKNIRRKRLEKFIHTMWNVIEDRYIDNFIFNRSPGYRGYYVAMYDRFWNSAEIDEYLVSDLFRYPSLASYNFRITNFTNLSTDLLALPRLEDIAKVIDLSNIDRLTTTKKRIQAAFKVTEIVLDCIDLEQDVIELKSKSSGQGQKGEGEPSKEKGGLADPRDYFDFGDDDKEKSEATPKEIKSGKSEEKDLGKDMVQEISDVLNGKDPDPSTLKENKDGAEKISDAELDKEVEKQLKEIEKKQRQFLAGQIPKEKVTSQQKQLLDLIEKHGITLVQVKLPSFEPGNAAGLKVDCIVVQKMTKELILHGADVFPLSSVLPMGDKDPQPDKEMVAVVNKGVSIGMKLGRKLQVRAETNVRKEVRKKSGKINKRLLHTAVFDAEDLFYKIHEEHFNDVSLHISVDASSSMAHWEKWHKTMTAVVAICKAGSMVHNIHITVSFRTTQGQGTGKAVLPYVVLAYDSRKDKFSKVKNLFPYLQPNGWTPEGLAFGAIMGLFDGITPDEQDRYFLNLSDGEPCYSLTVEGTNVAIQYVDDTGVSHTKTQVDKIRRNGVEILSYFIGDDGTPKIKKVLPYTFLTDEEKLEQVVVESPLRRNFRKMYGKTAKFIDVENVTDLAKTINDLFLSKCREKST